MKLNKEDIKKLTNKELAAQVIFPRLSADKYYSNKDYQQNIHSLVEAGIGGFCIFSGNMGNTASMIRVLQSMAKIPLLFNADFEYGLPMRLENGTSIPQAMALGKSDNTKQTINCATIVAKESKSIGVDWNLSPVCDVNSNSKNPIINIRAFGDNVKIVNEHIEAYIKGLHSEYILSCAKHFPGHGDTSVDSHLSLPVLEHSKKRIEDLEIKPFKHAIACGVKSIMIAHLSIPSLDKSGLPASLSKKIITNYLKNTLKFDGLILTDALEMKSITSNFSEKEAVLKALDAGNDILLLPPNPENAIKFIEKKLNKNPEFKSQIIHSIEKIINAKNWVGLFNRKFDNSNQINIPFSEHEKIALSAALNAIDTFNDDSLIPIREKAKVGGIAFLQNDDDLDISTMFFKILAQAIPNDCDFGFINQNIKEKDLSSLKSGMGDSDIMIFAFFFKPTAYQSLSIPKKIQNAYKYLSKDKKKIAIFFGNPYLIDEIKADLIISPYSDTLPSIAATILKLSGREVNLDI